MLKKNTAVLSILFLMVLGVMVTACQRESVTPAAPAIGGELSESPAPGLDRQAEPMVRATARPNPSSVSTGGDVNIGSTVKVTWKATKGTYQYVTIQLSRDDGNSWPVNLIKAQRATDMTSFSWKVTGPAAAKARIRVILDGPGGVGGAESPNFRIKYLTINLVAPANNAKNVTDRDQFTWTRVSGADRYIMVLTQSGSSNVYVRRGIDGGSTTLQGRWHLLSGLGALGCRGCGDMCLPTLHDAGGLDAMGFLTKSGKGQTFKWAVLVDDGQFDPTVAGFSTYRTFKFADGLY